jgi:epoxyqueuosine reductase QueG
LPSLALPVFSAASVCHDDPVSMACGDLFAELKNPYYVGDEVGLTQTAGWLDARSAQPSVFAVAAETTGVVVAAVNFARENVRAPARAATPLHPCGDPRL